ncbi:MAG: transglutaminaseTgpA domain-containing protein [Cyanobacteria bacterium J06638_20]
MSTGFQQSNATQSNGLMELWQRFKPKPPTNIEESIPLRVMVQLLVIVGIIAVDVAALDVVDSPGTSFWAVPMSAAGGCWSWYRRRRANILVKFCIAIAMLVALAIFFVRLLEGGNDTRLVLAGLLIQLQVFHSFDLPRRKDLGYSVVIGIILLGVAATLSQTLFFAPILLAFVAIAIPVLMLDYRSRLGVMTRGFRGVKSDLSVKRLGGFLLLTLALGLTIFTLMPRFPGYQIRNFPVSAPIDLQEEFNPETVINPGYVRPGISGTGEGEGEGTGEAPETGPGELNPEFYYGFNTRINQNLRGELEPQVVMRVRSQAEGFMRVMAFDRYTGQGWEVSRNDEEQLRTLNRSSWSFRFHLPMGISRGRRREVVQSYTVVVEEFPNLIPAMYEAQQLYFPTEEVAIDAEGGLRAPLPLTDGLTYTVVSQVPYRDRTRLQEATRNYPDEVTDYYLELPAELRQRVEQRTREILDNAPNPITSPYEQSLYLAQFLKQNYTVQTDLPFFAASEDLVEAFLFRYEGGYPDHFSTVLTVMLRSIGIPARVSAGFLPSQFNPFTGYYVVRNTDALLLPEVYMGGYGWFAFNPIPGMEVIPPTVNDYQAFGVLRQFWNWIAGWLPSPVAGFLNGVFAWIAGVFAWIVARLTLLLQQGWVGALIGFGLAIALTFVGWLGWNGWQSWRYHRWLKKLPPMEALYQQMMQWLKTEGLAKKPAQTPLEFVRVVRHSAQSLPADLVDEISHAYLHWRYGGETVDVGYLRNKLKTAQRQRNRRLPFLQRRFSQS